MKVINEKIKQLEIADLIIKTFDEIPITLFLLIFTTLLI